mmetsp:Transcript_13074/g.21397  ORF Transcript_13074/g.21397 Transcript_13074/m.21397 type:complete len:838 (+) Transcript_13074:169-2682(+)
MTEEEVVEEYVPTEFELREESNESIKVLVRVRPLSQDEIEGHGSDSAVSIHDANSLTVFNAETRKQFNCSFDQVLGDSSSQEDVYDILRTCTQSVTSGFNSTIFAYGQTGSGKTHTMFGPPDKDLYDGSKSLQGSSVGLIPRAINEIFELANHPEVLKFSVLCSFIQLYNENCYDMLRDAGMTTSLPIREDQKEIYVQGLSEYIVKSVGETMQLLRIAEENRAIRETHMNQYSSRSHSIFQIFVEQKRLSPDGGEISLRAKFNLVDLAGSEKWNTRHNMQDQHISELTNINLSLHTLGKCISALVTGRSGKSKGGKSHVPYRDSKLTRLLQDSIGGNSRTFLIATLSPSLVNTDETISTLKFADRAKQVMVQIHVNETRPVDHEMVVKLQREVQYLRNMLKKFTESGIRPGVTAPSAPSVIHINTNTDPNSASCTTAMPDAESIRRYEESNLQYIEAINEKKQAQSEMDVAFKQADDAIKTQKIASLELDNERLRFQVQQLQAGAGSPSKQPQQPPQQETQSIALRENNMQLQDSLNAMRQHQDMLWVQVNLIQDTLKKFFVFEIEEDMMRTLSEQVFVTLTELRVRHEQMQANALKLKQPREGFTSSPTPSGSSLQLQQQHQQQTSYQVDVSDVKSVSTPPKSKKKGKKQAAVSSSSPVKVSLPIIKGGASSVSSRQQQQQQPPPSNDLPNLNTLNSSVNSGKGGFAYRVRGGGSKSINGKGGNSRDSVEWIAPPTEEEDEAALRKKLAKAKKKIEKNLKIQEWLEKKEERAAAALNAEIEERQAMEAAEKLKEEKRKHRVAAQKKKLSTYYKQVKDECDKIQELQELGIDPSSMA